MQKKVIALAVAGALAAPALALAQDSGVVISGTIYGEYSKASIGAATAGTRLQGTDMLQVPGSNLRIRSTEKVAYGMTAWFQCESTLDFRGTNGSQVMCERNSALGLQGDFGNAYFGIWDTPFKRTMGNVGGRDTGIFGTAQWLAGNSTTVSAGQVSAKVAGTISTSSAGAVTGVTADTAADTAAGAGVFKRRQKNLITFDTPTIGGFQAMFGATTTNHATLLSNGAAGAKARVMSSAISYKNGPINLGGAYDKHKSINGDNLDATGYHVSADYTLGSVKLGAVYTVQKLETAATTTAQVKAYLVGAEWNIAGPHSIHASYANAGDITGSGTFTNRGTAGANTGARLMQVRYVNDLSKRTQFQVGVVQARNDKSGAYFLGGYSSKNGVGGNDTAYAVNMTHNF